MTNDKETKMAFKCQNYAGQLQVYCSLICSSERKKAKRRGNTEKMRMKQEVKTLQRQVCALQEEIACLKQKLSLASPSKDFTLSSCHRKVHSFAGDVERAPLTPQSDGSATTIGRALVPNGRKCIASRKYFCPKCTRSFSNYSLLCRHVGIHSGKLIGGLKL